MDTKVKEFEVVCRICLLNTTNVDVGEPHTIFETTINSLDIQLSDLFTTFTSLKMEQIDGFPTLICSLCLDTLVSAYEFQLKCIKSDHDIRVALGYLPQMSAIEKNNFEQPVLDPIKEEPPQILCWEEPVINSDEEAPNDDTHDEYIKDELESICSSHAEISVDNSPPAAEETKPKTFICSYCLREFLRKDSIAKHMKVHKKPVGGFPCQYCPKKFMDTYKFTRHLKIHKRRAPNRCDICDKTFVNSERLKEHVDFTHKGVTPHICSVCNKGFKKIFAFNEHMKKHACERPHLCSECGKAYKEKKHLKQHLLTHAANKPFQCPECPKQFHTNIFLRNHMVTHTGIKQCSCETCGAFFSNKCSLFKHKRIHENERRYACKLCDKRFNASSSLVVHIRSHTGEKPYKCDFCDRSCKTASDLTKHKRIHIGDTIYPCKECPAEFRMQKDLKKHHQEHYLQRQKLKENTVEIPNKSLQKNEAD